MKPLTKCPPDFFGITHSHRLNNFSRIFSPSHSLSIIHHQNKSFCRQNSNHVFRFHFQLFLLHTTNNILCPCHGSHQRDIGYPSISQKPKSHLLKLHKFKPSSLPSPPPPPPLLQSGENRAWNDRVITNPSLDVDTYARAIGQMELKIETFSEIFRKFKKNHLSRALLLDKTMVIKSPYL